jgi:hypothetical protein
MSSSAAAPFDMRAVRRAAYAVKLGASCDRSDVLELCRLADTLAPGADWWVPTGEPEQAWVLRYAALSAAARDHLVEDTDESAAALARARMGEVPGEVIDVRLVRDRDGRWRVRLVESAGAPADVSISQDASEDDEPPALDLGDADQCGVVGDASDPTAPVCVLMPGHDGPHRRRVVRTEVIDPDAWRVD